MITDAAAARLVRRVCERHGVRMEDTQWEVHRGTGGASELRIKMPVRPEEIDVELVKEPVEWPDAETQVYCVVCGGWADRGRHGVGICENWRPRPLPEEDTDVDKRG